MKRVLITITLVGLLLTGAVLAERELQRIERADPLGRKLLYLPSAEMLRLASLGNRGLVADTLYLWSIQYYSKYQPHERFLYLETVYNLITDLDPLYHDAYRVGALIMQLPTTDEEAHKAAVIRLFDKAIKNMPANYEIAEAAGWDMYIRYRDKAASIRYFEEAVAMPGAPHRLRRFLAVWSSDENEWSFDDALSYWLEVRKEADTDYDLGVSDRQIYRLFAARDEAMLNPVLVDWSSRHGRCPDSWQALVDEGLLRAIPLDYFGHRYRIISEPCSVLAIEGIRLD